MASDPKKRKVEMNGSSSVADDKQEELSSFLGFQITKILSENSERKSICIEGKFPGDRRSIVLLERLPLRSEVLPQILTGSTSLKKELVNDIYGQYECIFSGDVNGTHALKANVILPATQRHVDKYTESPTVLIEETPQLYHFVTQPFIDSERFTIDWVYNILEHKTESERIVYEDPDPETGFIILPDFKWSGKQTEDLYLVGIVHNKNIRSIRGLRQQHLPLLKKLARDGIDAITARYGVPRSQIRAYFHYQPSYYHLHVHYSHIQYNAPGINAEKAHLLPVVIHNLEQDPFYYSKAILPFTVKQSSKLFRAYQDAGYDFQCGLGVKAEPSRFPFEFLKNLGKAKHEPCGEHWNTSYGDSAWRMAIAALCLKSHSDKLTVSKLALSSAFTCLGHSTDQDSEWGPKMDEVRKLLSRELPFQKASQFYHLFFQHVACRRKACVNSDCHKVYRQIMELEETFLLIEELQKEGNENSNEMKNILFRKISEIPFDGIHGVHDEKKKRENICALINFFLKISNLLNLKRTGWVRSHVRDPERVAGHMFRMAVMSILLEEDASVNVRDVTDSPMVIAIVHDLGECIVGDITPHDAISDEEKHRQETEAFECLTRKLPKSLSEIFKKAFSRYESASPTDPPAQLVKDLDKFDMVLQAYEYELKEKRAGALEDFFKSTSAPDLFKHPTVQRWNAELRRMRQGDPTCVKVDHLNDP